MVKLETERLIIRRFESGDWVRLREIALAYESSGLAIYDHGPWPVVPAEYEKIVKHWSEGDNCVAVQLKDQPGLIGFISRGKESEKEYELGYNFHPDSRGRGYAFEACQAVLCHLFNDLGAERVKAGTAEANTRSRNLLEKLGFRFLKESTVSFRKDLEGNPIEFTGLDFELTRDEWRGLQGSQSGSTGE